MPFRPSNHRSRVNLRRFILILFLVILVSITVLRLQANETEPQTDAERVMEALQASFASSDSYRFTAQVEQVLIPLASQENIGRTEERIDSMLLGHITPNKNTLDLRFEGGDIPNLLLEQEDGNTFLIQNDERTLIDSPLSTSAPDGSFAGYLHAATNVVERSDPNFPDYSIFQFELDGDAFGAYMAEQMRANLAPNQQHRAVVPSRTATMMSGVGEVWLDADGILRRQIMDVNIPEVNDQYGSQSHFIIDYQYGDEASTIRGLPEMVVPLVERVVNSAETITTPTTPFLTPQTATQIAFILLAIGFAILLLRQPRSMRVTLPIFLAFLMVANPLLQSVAYASAHDGPEAQSLLDALNLGAEPAAAQAYKPAFDGRTPLLQADENTCGVSDDRETDTDEDGLSDFIETCLGTSKLLVDTDGDQVGDLIEVLGFVFTDTLGVATTYYSNPLEPDSNLDGQSDLNEYAKPFGLANKWDIDGDGRPNLWDTDDDGDGVSDAIDLNPTTVTEYRDFFRLRIHDHFSFDGYQIVEFQVQPQNTDHLRYSTTPLDWPVDTEGTLQDNRNRVEELTLTPYLKVYTSFLPSEELMDLYGIQRYGSESENWHYLYVPLSPVGDGGRIEAFSGKVVYELMDRNPSTGWRDTKLTWLAFYEQDDGSVDLVAEYEEDAYRFTGLNVTRQKNFDYAIFGTPSYPDDNLKLVQTMSALSASFLSTLQVDLDSLETRFITNPAQRTTWGLMDDVTMQRAETPSGYLDILPVNIANSYVNFLTNNSYPTDELASIIVAMEGDTGLITLDDFNLDQKTLKGNISHMTMAKVRNLNMSFLTYANNAWGEASTEEIADAMAARHDFDAAATALQGTYPDIDSEDLIEMLAAANNSFEDGFQTMVTYGDKVYTGLIAYDPIIEEETEPAPQENIFSYLLDVYDLGVPGSGLLVDNYEGYLTSRYAVTNSKNWDSTGTATFMVLGEIGLMAAFGALIYSSVRRLREAEAAGNIPVKPNRPPAEKARDAYVQHTEVIEQVEEIELPQPVRPAPRRSTVATLPDNNGTPGQIGDDLDEFMNRLDNNEFVVVGDDDYVQVIEGSLDDLKNDEIIVEDYENTPEGDYGDKTTHGGEDDGVIIEDLDGDGEFDVDELKLGDDYDDAGTPRFDGDAVCPLRRANPNCGVDVFDMGKNAPPVDEIREGKRFATWSSVAPTLRKVVKYVGALLEVGGLGLDLASIWTTYANFHSIYEYERTRALVFAVTMTVVLVLVAVLGVLIAPLGLAFLFIDLVFLLADLIGLAHGDSVNTRDEFMYATISVWWDVDARTRVVDFHFDGLEMELNGPMVVGNRMRLTDKFTGIIQAANNTQASIDQVPKGSSFARFETKGDSDAISIVHNRSNWDCSEDGATSYYDKASRQRYIYAQGCTNDLWATIDFDGPAINAIASIKHEAVFDTRYEECVARASFLWEDCDNHTQVVTLPDDLSDDQKKEWDFIDIPLDILPATITELWEWDELVFLRDCVVVENGVENLHPEALWDADGDGIIYCQEMVDHGTDPDEWDSDFDLLADAFEISAGFDPVSADSDGDGLLDGDEVRLGTSVTDPDSDDDGLLDSEEVSHYDSNGNWNAGGWEITIDGGTFFVFANPYVADLDRDGLNDSAESGVGQATTPTSPYAPNHLVPSVGLTASPLQISPEGALGVIAAQGDVVSATLTIDNGAAAAVEDVVKLCLPAAEWVATPTVVTSGANADNLPTHTFTNDCFEWDFSTQPLYQFFDFKAIVTGEIGASGDITTPITIEVPYTNNDGARLIQDLVPFTLDNTVPAVRITAPITNTRLAGDYFVMGGIANDDLTWIDHVKVNIPSGTFTATDTTNWAHTWELPDDGEFTVSATAYDAAGNASNPFPVRVTVDSLAPVITTSFADGATISAGEAYSDTILLNGTVTDNASGVVYIQMAYGNQPWRTIWTSHNAPQLSTTWNGVWELPNLVDSAQGEHTLRLRAADDYGNVTILEQTVFVDLLPPTAELTDRRFTAETVAHVPLNQPLPLQGVANDAGRNPIAAGPIALEGTLDAIDDATIWLQPDSYEDDDAGVTVTWIGDYNGDRLGDLALGFPNNSDGRGKVVIVTGRAGGWPTPNLGDSEQLFGKQPTFFGELGAGLGATIAPAGDFDGDGFEDMLVGDLANNRIFLVYGTAGQQGSNLLLDGVKLGKWDEISLPAGGSESFTTQFIGAGDVNNNSFSDILIATDTAVYLLAGGTPATTGNVSELAAASLAVGNASVAGVGDATGDMVDDFVIATGGAVYLFSGSGGYVAAGGSSLSTVTAVQSFATSDAAPTVIGAGDLNGDGFADFAFTNGDNPTVVYGGSYTTELIGGGFAATPNGFLAAAGDTNKDGNSDLLIGNADGNAYLLLGGSLNTIASTIEGVSGSASAPYTKGADLAGDGSADLLLVPSTSPSTREGTLSDAKPAHVGQNALPQRLTNNTSRPSSAVRRQVMTGDVTAGTEASDFLSIQDAIDSGANRVLIQPGVYNEAITLASNIELLGSGANLTTLMLPVSSTVLISADSVTNTTVANLKLIGDGSAASIGIDAENGAGVDLERLLIESMGTAVAIDGATNNVDLKNNSFIANINGIAATNCADLDVRNSIFAYNTGTALAYEACATIKRHEFNLFYFNGTDQMPNDPGSGEIFSNPRFLDYAAGDYRVEDISPVINAGSPGDAVPPGAGDIIDIGHIEQTGGGYVASLSYCSTCDNDGLIWGVNAFDTIQGAVNSAENDLLYLLDGPQLGEAGSQFTVGVDEGTYNESVLVNWNLQLLGSDPDRTTIQGISGPAVTLSSTVGTVVGGFTLIGGGATPVGLNVTDGSSRIHVTRNLIKDNTTGILFDDRSSGVVTFNTLVNNTTAIEATGKYNWADTNSNLISGNVNGLVASRLSSNQSNMPVLVDQMTSSLTMTVYSDPATSVTLTHGETITLVVVLENGQPSTQAGIQLNFFGTDGVNYQSVSGATCGTCSAADDWLVNVPDMASGEVHTVTLINQLDADLTGKAFVETDVDLYLASAKVGTTLRAVHNINLGQGTIFSDQNLLNNTIDYTNVISGLNDLIGSDPLVSGPYAKLTLGSPAIDAGLILLGDVPTGGGVAPDIGWHELTISPISVLMGQADDSVATESYGVNSVEYAIVPVAVPTSPVTSTLPSTWTAATLSSPDEIVTYWDTAFTPTTTGFYRIYSRATDGLGNAETNSNDWYDGAFYVDDIAPAVSITRLDPYDMASGSWIRMTAIVTDYVGTSFDINEIYFTVDGVRQEASWAIDDWEADGVTGRTFSAIYMNNTTSQQSVDVQAFAIDGAGQVGSSSVSNNVVVNALPNGGFSDAYDPFFTFVLHDDDYTPLPFDEPFYSEAYTGTISIEGVAVDPGVGSGVSGIQISFDGGLTWDTMELFSEPTVLAKNNRTTPYEWQVPMGYDATTIPVKLRVFDFSGKAGFAHGIFTIDTAGPRMRGGLNIASGPALGVHLDEITPVTFAWAMPIDGSDTLVHLGTFAEFDASDEDAVNTPPETVLGGNTHATTIRTDAGGPFYAKIGAQDEAGNITYMIEGPWYAGLVTEYRLPWNNTFQSIRNTLDGTIDIAHQEYLTPTEWLDDDPRPATAQSLYAAWDGGRSYVAWQGADWSTDGTMWVYYDLLNGGTTTPVSGAVTLPFEADVAVTTSDGLQMTRYIYDGSAWVESGSATSGYDAETRGLEYRVGNHGLASDTSQYATHRMMAYAVDDSGTVWSAFPTSNGLDGVFETYFDWNITEALDLLKLPSEAQLSNILFGVSADPSQAATLSHGDAVSYTIEIDNRSNDAATGVQLQLTGSAGINYQSVSGATCNTCVAVDSWLLDVPTMTAGAAQLVTVTAQLDADLTGLDVVTATIELIAALSDATADTVVHQLDLTPPTVAILSSRGGVINSGPQPIAGSADDGIGSGVELVEYSLDELSWLPANDTTQWSAVITPTGSHSSTLMIYARATDLHGQVSGIVSTTLVVDEVAPIITPTVPLIVGGATAVRLVGIASDPAPVGAEVAEVQIEIDGAGWESVELNFADADGVRSWWYSWTLPDEDGITHTIRYRAYDYAGNVVTTTQSLTTSVDTVDPTLNVTGSTTYVVSGSQSPALGGTMADGNDVESITALAYPSAGGPAEVLTPTIEANSRAATTNWTLSVESLGIGAYQVIVVVTDAAGNTAVSDPYPVQVVESVPTSVVTLDEMAASTTGNLAHLWVVLASVLGMAWVTLYQLRRKRKARQ